jgi:hypothetical protein
MASFREAVAGSGLTFRPGLQALGRDSRHVQPSDTRSVLGSANIDGDMRATYPNASRWDYAVCCEARIESVDYIEVHPATTSQNAREVWDKLQWLTEWLRSVPLGELSRRFHWINTGSVGIPKTNPRLKQLASKGIRPCRSLRIC